MHEAGPVRAAIARAGPSPTTGSALRVVVRDPTRADAGSVRFYAAAFLAEDGLAVPMLLVRVAAVHCALCGQSCHPTPTNPVCDHCGAPVSTLAGPAVEAQWRRPPRGASTKGIA